MRIIGFVFLVLSHASFAASDTPSAEDLLKSSDRSRGAVMATGGMTWNTTVKSIENGQETTLVYLVKVKGDDALAESLQPEKKAGELMLFNDRSVWFFKPGRNRKPVPISPRQKLNGPAANGDIASTNYYRDYVGKVIGSESVDKEDSWKLELKAKNKSVTYDSIIYWISKRRKLALKADFLTVGGEKFKTATFEYDNAIKIDKDTLPFISKMFIQDAVQLKNKSELIYQKPKLENHPDAYFNVNNLIR